MGKRRRALLFAGAVTVLAFVFILFFVLSGQISEMCIRDRAKDDIMSRLTRERQTTQNLDN